jgi:hypothetical protein
MTFAEHKVTKINRINHLLDCDKVVLHLKSFTYGLPKWPHVKGEVQKVKTAVPIGPNCLWLKIIFGL